MIRNRAIPLVAFIIGTWGMPRPAGAQQPVITELRPAQIVATGRDVSLEIRGSGFVPGLSRVIFDGRNLEGARVTPGGITVTVPGRYFAPPFMQSRDFRDGEKRVAVWVVNGRAVPQDVPSVNVRMSVYQPGHEPATPRAPKPVVASVGPSPVPVGGMLVVRGAHLNAPRVTLTLSGPSGRGGSSSRTLPVRARPTEIRARVAGVPAGRYTLLLQFADEQQNELLTVDRPVTIGKIEIGPPAITGFGPRPLWSGSRLWVAGRNFADDVVAELVSAAGGRVVPLRRAPNTPVTDARAEFMVPQGVSGDYVVRVRNPGSASPPAQVRVAVAGPTPPPARGGAPGEFAPGGAGNTRRPPANRRPHPTPTPAPRPRPTPPPTRSAEAFSAAIVANGNLCLVPDADRNGAVVRLQLCSRGGAMYHVADGYVSTRGGRCLDWGTVGGPIHLMPCKPGRPARSSQQWLFASNKLVQSLLHDDVCMDVEGGRMRAGTRVIAYRCKDYRVPERNQRFYPGVQFTWLQFARGAGLRNTSQVQRTITQGGAVVFSNGARVIASGGGNVIASGGANVIASGGANVISYGGGNVIASGGGNLRVVDGLAPLFSGASVIASGGANVISSGALNLLPTGRN